MAKRAAAKKSKPKSVKSVKSPKRASAAKPKTVKKTAVKATKRKSQTQSVELTAFTRDIENSMTEIRSQIGSFQTIVSDLTKRLEADRTALEKRLISLFMDAASPFKEQILVPLQHEVSRRLDEFGHQLTALAKSLEPGSGRR